MTNTLTYQHFNRLSPPEQLSFLDSFADRDDLKGISNSQYRFFFDKLILGEESNNFIKKKGIDVLMELTLQKNINKEFSYLLLLDIEDNADEYLLVSQIKNLFLLNASNKETTERIAKLKEHDSIEVCSEAYFKHGMLLFFDEKNYDNNTEFITDIRKAKNDFIASNQIDNNRKDAELYTQICNLLLSLFEKDLNKANSHLTQVVTILWDFQIQSVDLSIPNIDLQLYNILKDMVQIVSILSEAEIWDEIRKRFVQLCTLNYSFLAYNDTEHIVHQYMITEWKKKLRQQIINPYIEHNLTAKIKVIQHLIYTSTDEEQDLRDFLVLLTNQLTSDRKKNPFQLLL